MLDATTPEATPLTHRGGSLEADPTLDTALNSPGELLDPENIRAGRTGTNWLNDAQMLPSLLPGARIQTFSYPRLNLKSIRNKSEQTKYIDNAAERLNIELEKVRPPKDYGNIPIIFIGAGFGGMVVQRAITMAATPNNTSKDGTTSGAADATIVPKKSLAHIVFLDTPFPNVTGELEGSFPSNSNARVGAILKKMKRWEGPNVDSIWQGFWESLCRPQQEVRVLWLYSANRRDLSSKKVHPPHRSM
jgi:hypothetical protein